jgi:hypothetical protein
MQTGTKSPTNASFSYNTGFSKYVAKDSTYSSIGANNTINISRGLNGSKHTLKITNNL